MSLPSGLVRTPLVSPLKDPPHPTSLAFRFTSYLFCSKSASQGAQTTVHCVLAPKSVNGTYYSDCREHDGLFLNRVVKWDRRENGGRLTRDMYEKTKEYLKL